MKQLPIKVIPGDGQKGFYGNSTGRAEGAYTLSFVFSEHYSFLLKGYLRESDVYLKNLKESGLVYITKQILYPNQKSLGISNRIDRVFWKHSSDFCSIRSPHSKFIVDSNGNYKRTYTKDTRKWTLEVRDSEGEVRRVLKLKRFPNRWIPEFNYYF